MLEGWKLESPHRLRLLQFQLKTYMRKKTHERSLKSVENIALG